jgi:hypothetical protein
LPIDNVIEGFTQDECATEEERAASIPDDLEIPASFTEPPVERQIDVKPPAPHAPPPVSNSWWRRSTLRRLLRIVVGVNEDLAHGNAFKDMILANLRMQVNINAQLQADLMEVSRLVGMPPDGSFAMDCSINERLSFYEERCETIRRYCEQLQKIKMGQMMVGDNGQAQGHIHLLKPVLDAKDGEMKIEEVPRRPSRN